MDLHKSLVVSCDTYYYALANDLGIDNIYNFIGQFGLGKKRESISMAKWVVCCHPRTGK